MYQLISISEELQYVFVKFAIILCTRCIRFFRLGKIRILIDVQKIGLLGKNCASKVFGILDNLIPTLAPYHNDRMISAELSVETGKV